MGGPSAPGDYGHGGVDRGATPLTSDNWWAPQPDAEPTPDLIRNYIVQAAQTRQINPDVALAVASHEGFANGQPAERGTFKTGSSWWPFQFHYGGPGYEHYGTTAGLGNDFTAKTGWQPGDPKAWKDSVDFALDAAVQRGWYPTFYGSVPAGVGRWDGLPQQGAPPPKMASTAGAPPPITDQTGL